LCSDWLSVFTLFFSYMLPRLQCSTLFPYTTLFRSDRAPRRTVHVVRGVVDVELDHVRVEIGEPIDAGPRLFRRFADGETPEEARDRKSTRLNSVTWPSRMPSSA